MNPFETLSLAQRLAGNDYPGRGIMLGLTPDGRRAAAAYFIMGRSANSRNRVFAEHDGAVFTEPFDASKVEDPSLIIYAAVRSFGPHLIVTNGDQTDTVDAGLKQGLSFEQALAARCFEPDAPNFTPRISGLMTVENGKCSYKLSILKAGDEAGTVCNRFYYHYTPLPGVGHLIHTYQGDGNPLPTFRGEPVRVAVPDSVDELTDTLWNALNPDNRISLYVRLVDLATGEAESRLVNKHRKGDAQ